MAVYHIVPSAHSQTTSFARCRAVAICMQLLLFQLHRASGGAAQLESGMFEHPVIERTAALRTAQ